MCIRDRAKQGLDAVMMVSCPSSGYLPFLIGGQNSLQMQLREAKRRWHNHRARWQEDHLVNGATTITFRAEGHGQSHIAAAMRGLPAGERRRWWLSLCDTYPTGAYRYRTNQTDSSDCCMDGCNKRETYDHITCACPITSDAITVAHNKVWRGLYDSIVAAAPHDHVAVFDTPLGQTSLRVSPAIRRLRPDGVILYPLSRTICLLEFARTGDARPEYLDLSRARKERHYETLQREMATLYPDYTVRLVPFIIGARSFVRETDWQHNWMTLHLPLRTLPRTIQTTMRRNQEVITDILAVRKAALPRKPKKGDG